MRSLLVYPLLPLAPLLLLAASCYSFNAPATVKARHSIETHCPDDQVSVAELGNNRYRAIGCGSRATYACIPRSAGSEEWDCRPEMEQDPGTVFGTTQGGEQVRDSAHADAGVSDAAAPDAGGVHVDAGVGVGTADAGAPAADPTATVRAAIDSHAADILGCTGRSSIGVRATWDAHGAVTFALPGDLAGRPEESCVRSAIGPLNVPGAAGELMQLVRRVIVARVAVALVAVLAAACTTSVGSEDAGTDAAASGDAASSDGPTDAGSTDAGAADAGSPDSGSGTDAGTQDAGASFTCSSLSCARFTQFCDLSDVPECLTMPATCPSPPTCACLDGMGHTSCMDDGAGGITTHSPGG